MFSPPQEEQRRRSQENDPLQSGQDVGGRLESRVDEEANRAEQHEAGVNHQAGEQRKGHFLTLVERPQKQQSQGNFQAALNCQELRLALLRLNPHGDFKKLVHAFGPSDDSNPGKQQSVADTANSVPGRA